MRLYLFTLVSLFMPVGLSAQVVADIVKDSTRYEVQTSAHIMLDEVQVRATSIATTVRNLNLTYITLDSIAIRGRYEQSLMPSINEEVAGLFVTSRGVMGYGVSTGAAGGIKIRGIGGSPTGGVLVLIDGHPQYMGLMGHSVADSYLSIMAGKVEVSNSPASVLYGSNAMGGVINIVSNDYSDDGLHTSLRSSWGSYNSLRTELSTRYRKGAFGSTLNLSYDRTDGHRRNMDFEQLGLYSRLSYEINKRWSASADLSLSGFDASNPGTESTPLEDNDAGITRGAGALSLTNNYGVSTGVFRLFYNFGMHEINDGFALGDVPKDYLFNSRDHMFGLQIYQSLSLVSGNTIGAGIDLQRFGGEAWNQFDDGREVYIVDKSLSDYAAYLTVSQRLTSILSISGGIRADRHSVTGTEWVPQGGLTLRLAGSSEIKASVSKGFRNPSIREMYMFPPQNPNLLPERLVSSELSYNARAAGEKLQYSIAVYYIEGENLISTVIREGRPLNVNSDRVENSGFELNMKYSHNNELSFRGNYSYLYMKYPVLSAPENKFFAGVDFSPGKFTGSLGIQYISGLYKDVNNGLKEEYLLLNLRLTYRAGHMFSLFIRGENLLDRTYEIIAGYTMPGTTLDGGFSLTF